MSSPNEMINKILAAETFIDRSYMNDLNRYRVMTVPSHELNNQLIRLFRIAKIVYDSDEAMDERLVSIFHAVMPFCRSLVLIIRGTADRAELYLGVKAAMAGNAPVAGSVLHDSFLGNFPGTRLEPLDSDALTSVFEGFRRGGEPVSVASLSMIPSERGQGKTFVQGLEKFIDAMRSYDYTVEIIACPKSAQEADARRQGLEDIYTALSPFAKETASHGVNVSDAQTEGVNESISRSISDGISKAVGHSEGHNRSTNSSLNIGLAMLMNFGFMHGRSDGYNVSSSNTDTRSYNTTNTDTYGRHSAQTHTQGTTDSLSVEYRNKTVENLLEKIDRHLTRIKQGAAYGLWEAAAFFIGEKKTAAMASGIYASLLAGEESGIENVNINFFEESDRDMEAIRQALCACQFPLFRIPMYEMNGGAPDVYFSAPTCYINGRELALLMNLPRKSVAGVNVTRTAEFGRNPKSAAAQGRDCFRIGAVYHMGQTERTPVQLDRRSLTGHCFVTGSTGSGKSNTVYRLIEALCEADPEIPFLVIEPAKGEYRDEFRKIDGINLFSTNPTIDQMLKINPFSFPEEIHVLEHLDRLVEIFNGCWEMYAAMPAILKEAMEQAYLSKGWDLLNSVYTGPGAPVYPTFSDLLAQLPVLIASSRYSDDTKGDYIGALVTRVNSLTNGIYGQIFCDEIEVTDEELFDESAVVDLSRVGSAETKSLLMGVLILKLTEYRMAKAQSGNAALRHVTVLEEAHNILKNTRAAASAAGSTVVAKSVEMIVNSIAEMRTYGEGFIIVDQSPTSVDIAAVKNTNTKIIMRLPEKDDCEIAGRAVSLNRQQIEELSKLETGVAVVMQNDWELPILTKIDAASHRAYSRPPRRPYAALKRFHSDLLLELLRQYVQTDERNVERLLRVIDAADISDDKKPEYRRLVRQFHERLSYGFDSRLVGSTLLRLTGCADAIRYAEGLLAYAPEGEHGEKSFTPESLRRWYAYVDDAMRKSVDAGDAEMESIRQYILFSKQFGHPTVDYALLYRQLYPNIH